MTKKVEQKPVPQMESEVYPEYFSANRAAKYRPIFKRLLNASRAEVRAGAASMLGQLDNVREDIDYSPLSGHQVLLHADERKAMEEARAITGGE